MTETLSGEFHLGRHDEQRVPLNDREQTHVERPVEITVDDAVSMHREAVHIFASFRALRAASWQPQSGNALAEVACSSNVP